MAVVGGGRECLCAAGAALGQQSTVLSPSHQQRPGTKQKDSPPLLSHISGSMCFEEDQAGGFLGSCDRQGL